MKILHTILFSLIFCNLYSQRLTCEQIDKYKLTDIYNELIKEDVYSVEDSKCLGEKMSKRDSTNGIRQILIYYGPFTTGCLKCLYHKFGLKTYEFASNDLIFETIDSFIQAYNETMLAMLNSNQRKEIDNFDYNSNEIFTSFLTTKNQYDLELINDSTLNFKMHSDTLEYLFKRDVDLIAISIGDSINDVDPYKLSYSDLKTKGFKVKTGNDTKMKLFVCYDFSSLPNKYGICWCEILETKYRMIIPLILK
jgi:hypothetical protein